MDFVEAIGVTADTATLEETDEVDDIKRAVAAELSEKDARPHVGFYL